MALTPHRIPISTFSVSSVAEAYVRLEKEGKARAEYVRSENLRATQSYLHNENKGQPAITAPKGVRTPDGLVHVFDGHHRANQAIELGVTLFMSVVEASPVD